MDENNAFQTELMTFIENETFGNKLPRTEITELYENVSQVY